jgi:peptidoglycan/xylan/chitin deacetylase (PgdA/CDA1 family)
VAAGLRALLLAALVSGCTTPPPKPTTSAAGAAAPAAAARAPVPGDAPVRDNARGAVLGSHPSLLVYEPAAGDSWAGIAERFFAGDGTLGWAVARANPGSSAPEAGQPLIVPRQPPSPLGVSADGVQTVPVLCYHRFIAGNTTAANKMQMPAAQFEAQLQWLQREGWQVLRLAELQAFLDGQRALPPRSVVITVDDGWESFHRHAFPLLRKYGVPVTLFVATDLVGTRDGLSWAQLRELAQSGLVDVQAHSKSHRNLAERAPGETDATYRRALAAELRQPRLVLERELGAAGVRVRHFAYPFGDSNDTVLALLATEPYQLAFTVKSGGNAFYATPQLLRRTMIFGDHTLDDFAARLQALRPLARP